MLASDAQWIIFAPYIRFDISNKIYSHFLWSNEMVESLSDNTLHLCCSLSCNHICVEIIICYICYAILM